ncbi:hypothetical protein NE236_13185 [Actinoallomurus purpureus]|uniref:hypothetical protein n=1 Tax=Actinoallomurus purpureus TaxID=478114 RepID=UPI002091FC2E|nr:hypothetical protein [Actinoallomurus purpureus]MCO6005940.1 hypothetical protein [Actinoallomurus purpureus]
MVEDSFQAQDRVARAAIATCASSWPTTRRAAGRTPATDRARHHRLNVEPQDQRVAGRIVILPGSGITERTAARVAEQTGAQDLHNFTASEALPSPSRYSPARHLHGRRAVPPETVRAITTTAQIQRIIVAAT